MTKQKMSAVLIASLLAASATTAAMADGSTFDSHNVYVGGNVGYGEVDNGDNSDSSESGIGWNAHVGYNNPFDLSSQLAFELGYSQFPNKQLSILSSDSNYVFSFAAKWTIPLQAQWGVFGKAGLGYENNGYSVPVYGDVNNNGLVGYLGAGASYQYQPNLAIVGELDSTVLGGSNLPDMWLLSVGVNYQF